MSFEEIGIAQRDGLMIPADMPRKRMHKRPRREAQPKERITLQLDLDVVSIFKATGRGWQTRMNAALRDWLGPPWTS